MGKIMYKGQEFQGKIERSGGGSIVWPDIPLYWDFTKSFEEQNFKSTIEAIKSIVEEAPYGGAIITDYDAVGKNSVTITNDGAYIDRASGRISLYTIPSKTGYSRVYEIEFGEMGLTAMDGHKDIFCYKKNIAGLTTGNAGLIFRYNNSMYTLAVWDGSWEESNITDTSYFSNSILKIKILSNNKWEIYKDDELVFSPNMTMPYTPASNDIKPIYIASSDINNQSYYNMYVKNAKAYYEEET